MVRELTPDTLQTFIATESKADAEDDVGRVSPVLRHASKVAVGARVISVSPAAELEGQRPDRPIRKKPTREEFQAIVAKFGLGTVADQSKLEAISCPKAFAGASAVSKAKHVGTRNPA